LSIDFTLTGCLFICKTGTNFNASNPAILRIYQEDNEAEAVLMEITGPGT
tara:strand:- start:2208 stop:2357 length:150 start_codon:yes stop_codon:yes gene_type:complete